MIYVNQTVFKAKSTGRSPRLDTILMVEKALFEHKSGKTVTQIWKLLPKKTMWTTYTTIISYLEYLGKIRIGDDNTVAWTWKPFIVKSLGTKELIEVSASIDDNESNNITKIKKMILPILKKEGVVHASIFGSTARGEAKKDSDVDFLVSFGRKRTDLFDIARLKAELQEKLKRKVDLVKYKMVDKEARKAIFKEKVDIL